MISKWSGFYSSSHTFIVLLHQSTIMLEKIKFRHIIVLVIALIGTLFVSGHCSHSEVAPRILF